MFPQVDSVLDQRKRKGVLEYLVQWKGAESGQDKSWEPATKLAESCATLISSFIKSKTKKVISIQNIHLDFGYALLS